MAKKRTTPAGPPRGTAPRLRGRTFAFVGEFGDFDLGRESRRIRAQGWEVVKGLTPQVDYVVADEHGDGPALRREVEELNREQKASVRIIDSKAYLALFAIPTARAIAMLRGGGRKVERWNTLYGGLPSVPVSLRGAQLSGLKLPKIHLDGADLRGADLRDADLTEASLSGCDLTGANLAYAHLVRADFGDAKLVDTNLCGADLRGAHFHHPDLRGARVGGANFEGAELVFLEFGEDQFVRGGRVGPNARELDRLAREAASLSTTALLRLGQTPVKASITAQQKGRTLSAYCLSPRKGESIGGSSLLAALIKIANGWAQAHLDFSVRARGTGCRVTGKALTDLARAAWCEVFGVAVPSAQELKTRERASKNAVQAQRDELLGLLRGGAAGVKKWNARKVEIAQLRNFRRVDLSGLEMEKAVFPSLDMAGANFDGAVLAGAHFEWPSRGSIGCPYPSLRGARFRDADLSQAVLSVCNCSGADFTGARMSKARLRVCNFQSAVFRNADLTDADLSHADLREAELSGADLCGADLLLVRPWGLQSARFDRAIFDESTTFPPGFQHRAMMVWKGKGPHPGGPDQ